MPNWLKIKAKKSKNVLVLGYVPKIEEYILSSDVCIAPIRRGSGIRLKILEYMAAGKPIVSTEVGAEGLPLKTGVNAILCKEVDSNFLNSILNLLQNDEYAHELGLAAKTAKNFSWEKIGESLYNFYDSTF